MHCKVKQEKVVRECTADSKEPIVDDSVCGLTLTGLAEIYTLP